MHTDKHGCKKIITVLVFVAATGLWAQTFREAQLAFPRVRAAKAKTEPALQRLFEEKKLAYPPQRILIRVFKQERVLEVWVAEQDGARFQLLKEYAVCALSGELGPKRRVGDGQIPEGFYFVNDFNPASQFHLSLRVNYPNDSDRKLGARNPGGDIFIHGDCVTIGCVPITDDGVREVYWLAVQARAAGQARIPVHIFPARLTDANLQALERAHAQRPSLLQFWKNLKEGYDGFEKDRTLPRIAVSRDGSYSFPK